MKTINPVFFVLFIALIIWPMNFFLHGRQPINPHTEKLSHIVQEDEFLIGLHDTHGNGCIALKHLSNVDTIIIGSSHAYASIDAYALKEAQRGKRVDICAIAAWNTDFLHEFMTFLKKENVAPKRIIWIADSAVPLRLNLHQKRLEYAKAIFSDEDLQKQVSDKWIENQQASLPILGLTKNAYEERNLFHENQINMLPTDIIKQRLNKLEDIATGNLQKVLTSAKVNPLNQKNLRRFCIDLKLHGIDLDIVISPIPRKVSDIISQNTSTERSSNLYTFFKTYTPCAKNIISKSLEDWGLDARHFMNRGLKNEYPYEVWNDPEALELYYKNLPPRLQSRFYSPDHLNAIGAQIFTKNLSKVIMR